jgi:hypothetical protein
MDHEDVLEQLELAAVEPGGLDRLMAGDTATAAAVVGHLAGCDPCSEELRRLSRAVPLVRDLVRTTPPADLRERTLAYVRAHGRPRGEAATPVAAPAARAAPPAVDERAPARIRPWAAAAAVAVLVGTAAFLAGRSDADRYERAVGGLEAVNQATIDISDDADLQRVALTSTDGSGTAGTLLFSPSTTQLVVVASDLPSPPSGQEYRCWVEVDGGREDVGRMFFGDDLAFWVGDTPAVSDLPAGTTFGVSLVDVGSPSLEADPVIVGEL